MRQMLLHGASKAVSRKKLLEIKQKFDTNNVVVFEEGSDLQSVLGNLVTPSLFSDQQLIILENPPEDFINFPLSPSPLTLVFWFDHEVGEKKPIMEWAKINGQIFFFPEAKEASVFLFLDYLVNQDKKAFLELDKLKRVGLDTQYFITMVFYLLRNLSVTPKNAKPFMKEKLERQRRSFSLEKIISLYKEILEIDFKIKSGLLEKDQAEFLLVNLFGY